MDKLPETWYVKVTNENVDILKSWSNLIYLKPDIHIVGKVYRNWAHNYTIGYNSVKFIQDNDSKTGYTFGEELSFSEFERLVLNKKKNYELW